MPLGKCPGIAMSKKEGARRVQVRSTKMHCEECSAYKGQPMYLCKNKLEGGQVLCHVKYHNKYHCQKYLQTQALLKEQNSNILNLATLCIYLLFIIAVLIY